MHKYYFTYGSDPQYPYHRGQYVVVFADSMQEAVELYRIKYPDVHKGIINCAFYYNESQWEKIKIQYPGRYQGQPEEVINQPSPKDILKELSGYLIDQCRANELDNISIQVKRNGQVIAVAEYKDTDGKQTFTRISRRDSSKQFIIL